MSKSHHFEILQNNTDITLDTAGKYCDRNITVTANIDEEPIREAGIAFGVTQGREREYSTFWDAYQDNGNRTDYERAFWGKGWTAANYHPKYDLAPTNAAYMYQYSNIEGRVEVDTSQCTAMDAMFGMAKKITTISTIDTRNISALAGVFGYMDKLENIDMLILKDDGSQTFTQSCFSGDFKLKEIRIQGKIGETLYMRCQALSKGSITSIFKALSDDVSGKTLHLSQWVKDDLTEAEWSALTGAKQNWTISFA